jgi:hypothetical protein
MRGSAHIHALAQRNINTTHPDSRLICRRGKAPVQGYNVQAVATAGQILIATDVTQRANDSTAGTDGPQRRRAVARRRHQ